MSGPSICGDAVQRVIDGRLPGMVTIDRESVIDVKVKHNC
jgi:hypothetical protein